MKKQMISLLVAVGLIFGVSQAFAINITIPDNAPGTNWSGSTYHEDNETEPGTVQGQVWDLEAFVVSGTTLHLIGGYNMQAGEAGSGSLVNPGMLLPGDLFIKVGGTQPGYLPDTPTAGTVSNSNYGYTHVVDLTQPVGATSASADVYTVNSNSVFDSVVYDQFGGNPWRYNSNGFQLPGGTAISYTSGLDDATIASLHGVNLAGGFHNVLSVDLSFLGTIAGGTSVWFSYTMECGNDSIKGRHTGGFYQVPDATTSALLIGLGLAAMSVFGFKRRKA